MGRKGGGKAGLGSRGPKANQLWDIIEGIPTISRGDVVLKE